MASRLKGPLHVTGTLSADNINYPPGSVGDADIEANAGIDPTKVKHRLAIPYAQAPGANIVAATIDLHIARAAGLGVALEAAVTGVQAGGDRTVTVDLHKGNAATPFATVLTTLITLSAADALRTPEAAVVDGAKDDLADGDILRLIVALGGSAGTQPQGLIVTLTLDQNPQ